jgi:YVTN family beta-propeller protein
MKPFTLGCRQLFSRPYKKSSSKILILQIIAITLCLVSSAQKKFVEYNLFKRIATYDSYGWDYAAVDETNRHLFVSHGVKVLIIDTEKDSLIGEISNTFGVHGIAIAAKLNKGFTSNGRTNSITVFDLTTFKTLDTIAISGQNPDAIMYDAFSNRLFTFNGRSKNTTVIDASTLKVIDSISLSGKPEFAVNDGNGNVYVNIEDKSTIVHIDSKKLSVLNEWPIHPGEEASGLAIDIKNKLLFSVCDNSQLIVFDYEKGKVVASLAIGKGADAVVFDPATKLIYSSNGEGTVSIFQQQSKEKYIPVQLLVTQKGCRTMALDGNSKKIYLSAGKYQEGKRILQPGSFEVLVYHQ